MPGERLTIMSSPSSAHRSKSIRSFFKRIYSRHHSRRFEWLRNKIASLGKKQLSILELGCNDARSLSYVPAEVTRYVGLDAGWQSGWRNGKAFGLEAARHRFRQHPHFEFRESDHCSDLEQVSGTFDLAIVLETFEYLDPSRVEGYISALSRKLKADGSILSTMPNEKGIPLIVKALGSRLSGVPRSGYTMKQFGNAVFGRLDKVPRAIRGRRGFDYAKTAVLMSRYFPDTQLESIEPAHAPLWLSLNIGVSASKSSASVGLSEEHYSQSAAEYLCANSGK
jgi:Methyltransferase domain